MSIPRGHDDMEGGSRSWIRQSRSSGSVGWRSGYRFGKDARLFGREANPTTLYPRSVRKPTGGFASWRLWRWTIRELIKEMDRTAAMGAVGVGITTTVGENHWMRMSFAGFGKKPGDASLSS